MTDAAQSGNSVVTRTQEGRRRRCDQCGEPATQVVTYLLEGTRSNPASSAYGRDDCSYCSDLDLYACGDEHARELSLSEGIPKGYVWCSIFKKPHESRLIEWVTVDA